MNTCKTYNDAHRAGPGASTALMILLVMCLALLGALSLSVAGNDRKITDRAIIAETAFYNAQSEAARAVAEADEAIFEAWRSAADTDAWRENLAGIEGYDPETGMIAMRVPVDEYREISIALRPMEPGSDMRFEIIEHRVAIQESTGGFEDGF